ncbi:tyrosine-type recombinase/integrase [Bacillus cereus group sp. Bce015]|uniref:tyrosine-type recombinase/integrase n=2 Tax=unclassified Bacillus cereus group TaxID=2750818 RepID=UPI003F297B57
MSKKLEASHKKIDKVFHKMFLKGISVKGEITGTDKRYDESSVETYSALVKSLMNTVHKEFGIADIRIVEDKHVREIVNKRVDGYFSGNLSESWNVKTMLSAVKAFNLGVEKTNIFKSNKFAIADVDSIKKELREQHVIRNSKASHVLRATPKESEFVLDRIKNTGYQTKTRELAFHVSKIAHLTGGRITSILSLKASDIAVTESKIHFIGDKGGLSRSVEVGKETIDYLKSLKEGKEGDQDIFTFHRKNGTFKKRDTVRREIERIVKDAGAPLTRMEKIEVRDRNGKKKIVEVERKFTPHAFRKGFAIGRIQHYLKKYPTEKAMDKYVAERIREDSKLKQKLDAARERINKDRKEPRELTREEYAIFFTSVSLGHFRNSVIKDFYADLDEVMEYYEEKVVE